MNHPSRETSISKAITALNNLKDMNVSYVLAIHMEGKTQTYGTVNATKAFEECQDIIEPALIEDAVDLCTIAVDNVREKRTNRKDVKKDAFELRHGKGIKRLQYPLNVMNRKESAGH